MGIIIFLSPLLPFSSCVKDISAHVGYNIKSLSALLPVVYFCSNFQLVQKREAFLMRGMNCTSLWHSHEFYWFRKVTVDAPLWGPWSSSLNQLPSLPCQAWIPFYWSLIRQCKCHYGILGNILPCWSLLWFVGVSAGYNSWFVSSVESLHRILWYYES